MKDNTEPAQVWGVGLRRRSDAVGGNDYTVFVVGPEGEEVEVLSTMDMLQGFPMRITPRGLRDKLSVSEKTVVEWLTDLAEDRRYQFPGEARLLRRAADAITSLRAQVDAQSEQNVPNFSGVSVDQAAAGAAAWGHAMRKAAEAESGQEWQPDLGRVVVPSDRWSEEGAMPEASEIHERQFNDDDRPDRGGYPGWVVPVEISDVQGDTVTLTVAVNVPTNQLDRWGPLESVRVRLEAAGTPDVGGEGPESAGEPREGPVATFAASVISRTGVGRTRLHVRVPKYLGVGLAHGDDILIKLSPDVAERCEQKYRDHRARQARVLEDDEEDEQF